jgi:hypothetical protein
MFAQMRLALQAQRHKEHFESSAIPAMVARKSEEALYMATQGGANAIGLGHLVGSLTPGKKADVVVMRCDDINVVPVINPVGTLIYNSTPSNIDTVFIDGHLAKQGGNLVGVDWPSLRKEMQERSAALVAEAKKVDILPGVKAWKGLFGMSPDTKTLWDGSRSNLLANEFSCVPKSIFISNSFSLRGSSEDLTGDIVVCGVVVPFPFLTVFDRFRYRKGEHRLLARSQFDLNVLRLSAVGAEESLL